MWKGANKWKDLPGMLKFNSDSKSALTEPFMSLRKLLFANTIQSHKLLSFKLCKIGK